jgi:tetratricopeptide (TPR) repeat protein
MIRALKRSFAVRAMAAAAAMIVAVPGASLGGPAAPLPQQDERWIEVRTAHFRFFSNAGVSATRKVALDLEELRAVLAELTEYELQSPLPTLIYVFKGQRSFAPYKFTRGGEPARLSGYFLGRRHGNYIAIAADSRDASAIIFHEYVHYVAATNLWWMPLWLSEGLAELYQTFEVVGSTASIGLPIRSHLALLRDRTLIPLPELLAADQDSPLYHDHDAKGAFYAQSWALTHYLMLGSPARRQQLGRYLDLLQRGTAEPDAFRTAFATDYRTLESEVRAHLRGPRIPYVRAEAAIDLDTSLEVREMAYADVLYRLGDLLAAQLPERPEAAAFFEAAVAVDPGHAPAWTSLALAAERRADWKGAAAAYRRAALPGPDDAATLFHWGSFLRRRGHDAAAAVEVLRRAVAADPSFAPAWLELSSAYSAVGEASDDAWEAARNAHLLVPSDVAAARNLLRLALRRDDRAQAVRVIDRSFADDRRRAGDAWMSVVQHDLMRSRELRLGGDLEAARARLEIVEADLAQTARPDIIRERVASERRAIFEREAAATYDLAARLYAEGDGARARELLEELLAALPSEGATAWSCRSLLAAIDHPERFNPQTAPEVSPTQAEIARLNELLGSGSFKAAVEWLLEVRGRSPESRRPWIDAKIRELEATLEYNRYVDGYNRAVELFNGGQFKSAAEVLEQLIGSLPDGPHAESARTLLEDARRAESGR